MMHRIDAKACSQFVVLYQPLSSTNWGKIMAKYANELYLAFDRGCACFDGVYD